MCFEVKQNPRTDLNHILFPSEFPVLSESCSSRFKVEVCGVSPKKDAGKSPCHGHIDHDEMPMRYELHMPGTVLVEVHSAQPLRKLAFVDLCFNNSKVTSVETCAGSSH